MPEDKGIHCVCCIDEHLLRKGTIMLPRGHRERIAPRCDNDLSHVLLCGISCAHSFCTGTLHEAYHRSQSSADQASLKASHKHIQLASSYFMEKRINGGNNRKYLGLQRLQQLNLVSCAMHTAVCFRHCVSDQFLFVRLPFGRSKLQRGQRNIAARQSRHRVLYARSSPGCEGKHR